MKIINEDWLNIIGFGSAGLIICIFFILILVRNKKNKKIQLEEEKLDPSAMELQQGAKSDVYTPRSGTRAMSNEAAATLQKGTWVERLRDGLERTRSNLAYSLNEFFLNHKDKATRDETLEKLFEILISCDVGVETTEHLVSRVKSKITAADIHDYKSFESLLKSEILEILSHLPDNPKGTIEHPHSHPHVVLLVGVNGVGKTTTTGKLAYIVTEQKKKVIIGAADTFRAAAVEQLAIWAQRAHAELIQLKENADPASVAFECVKRAVQENFDLCLIDTAGRLQTRHDLMQELSKVGRVISKNMPDAPHEVLLVLDASMGQNAIEQAKLFQASVHVTGIVLTKLDGTAKGGVVLAIASKLKLPIRYIGVGEGVFDLQPFNANEYTEALFS